MVTTATKSIPTLQVRLARMRNMFTAYQEMLNPAGQAKRATVERLLPQVQPGCADKELIVAAESEVALMPDPRHIDRGAPWLSWFDLNGIPLTPVIGDGCEWPCQQCFRGNIRFRSINDPLPVVIHKLEKKPEEFVGYMRNDLMHWKDPFFGASIDGILEYALRLNPRIRFNALTRGWDIGDLRAQRTAENIVELFSHFPERTRLFELSFHLGLSRYDLIREVYDAGGEVPERLINIYAERYANNIKTLGRLLANTLVYFVPNYHPTAPLYNEATFKTIEMILNIIGKDDETRKSVNAFLRFRPTAPLYPPTQPSMFDGFSVSANYIEEQGRGKDFLRRLEAASKGDKACLRVSTENLDAFHFLPTLPSGNYPKVEIYSTGKVVVRRIGEPNNILVRSTLDELDPF